jgi:hypothetical protein
VTTPTFWTVSTVLSCPLLSDHAPGRKGCFTLAVSLLVQHRRACRLHGCLRGRDGPAACWRLARRTPQRSECAVPIGRNGQGGVFEASSRQGQPDPLAGNLVSAGSTPRRLRPASRGTLPCQPTCDGGSPPACGRSQPWPSYVRSAWQDGCPTPSRSRSFGHATARLWQPRTGSTAAGRPRPSKICPETSTVPDW